MIERMPTGSTATGFSMNTCLPASMAAFTWMGRKPGGAAVTMRLTSGHRQTPL